jgi:hypothetical protein
MNKFSTTVLCMLMLGLTACSEASHEVVIPVQHWKDIDVRVETHPNPPVAGMTEVVAIVTGPHGRPVGDMVISIRGNDSMPWVQTIQDGRIGVYRRAVDLGDVGAMKLEVHLQQGDKEKIMLFPLTLVAG